MQLVTLLAGVRIHDNPFICNNIRLLGKEMKRVRLNDDTMNEKGGKHSRFRS